MYLDIWFRLFIFVLFVCVMSCVLLRFIDFFLGWLMKSVLLNLKKEFGENLVMYVVVFVVWREY